MRLTNLGLPLSLVAAFVGCGAFAQESVATAAAPSGASAWAPVTADERRQIVSDLADRIASDYLFPEIGLRYAAMLREKLAAGAYDALGDPEAFCRQVTADLQAVHPDLHLRLGLAGARGSAPSTGTAAALPASARASGPQGLEDAKMIGDVAYLRFNMFPNTPETAEKARAFLLAHADARAVIIDARPHRGGGMLPMDAMLPLFFSRTTPLLRMDTRASVDREAPFPEGPTLKRRESSAEVVRREHLAVPDAQESRLRDAPIYYLTSRRTASAGEHLALALKRTGRATLIGETTRGAGHFGGFVELGRFTAFVPFGRTFDPDTGKDWEGTGVEPHVAVPADAALDEALRRIG
jgi:hypothetical protein